jgi:hypothetical protein
VASSDDDTVGASSREAAPGSEVHVQYARLRSDTNSPAQVRCLGVDPLRRERALSTVEFVGIFRMSQEQFFKQPPWKQESSKRRALLF